MIRRHQSVLSTFFFALPCRASNAEVLRPERCHLLPFAQVFQTCGFLATFVSRFRACSRYPVFHSPFLFQLRTRPFIIWRICGMYSVPLSLLPSWLFLALRRSDSYPSLIEWSNPPFSAFPCCHIGLGGSGPFKCLSFTSCGALLVPFLARPVTAKTFFYDHRVSCLSAGGGFLYSFSRDRATLRCGPFFLAPLPDLFV